MPYLGNPAQQRFSSPRAASVYSGDGSTVAFTLEEVVTTDEDILVSVDGVIQEPSVAYAVSSGTTLTFTAAPSSNAGNNIFVYYIARTFGSVSMPDGQNVNAATGSFSGAVTAASTVTVTDDLIVDTTSLIVDASSNKIGMGVDPSTMPSFATHSIKTANGGGVSITSPSSDDNRYIFFGNGTSSSDIQLAAIKNTSSDLSFLGASGQVQMVIDSTGAVTKPLQPAFLVRPASDQNNPDVNSGNPIDVVFGAEIFDQNGDFASNTFTAPVTGKYFLSTSLRLQNTDMDNAFYYVDIVTSNRSLYQNLITLTGFDEDMSFLTLNVASLTDMDAGDTAKVQLGANGSGNDTVDVDTISNFSGYLVC